MVPCSRRYALAHHQRHRATDRLLWIDLIFRGIDLAKPGTLRIVVLVLLSSFARVHRGGTKALLRHVEHTQLARIGDHIAVQLQVVHPGVTPHQPGLPVVIDHHRGVDMVPRTVLKQRLSDGIPKGTNGRVGYSYTNGHTLRNLRVGTDIPVKLAIALDGLRGPGSIVSP